MRHLSFDDLWENHLFDYKDGDLLVIDDIMRLRLNDYLHTTLAFIMVAFCRKGDVKVVIDEHEYLLVEGSLLVYLPGQMLGEIRPSPDAQVKLIAFAQRAIDRSLYLNKYVWERLSYVKNHPLFTLDGRERQVASHYYGLMMLKTQKVGGVFLHDVVWLLFQSLILEIMMLIDCRQGEQTDGESAMEGNDSSVHQSALVYRRFMALLAESAGRLRSVSAFADRLNVTPKYLSKCVKEESGSPPLDHIHEMTVNAIRQQLRYSNRTIKEISTDLDFPNLSFFGKFVKEHLGMSPTEYRHQNLKEGVLAPT